MVIIRRVPGPVMIEIRTKSGKLKSIEWARSMSAARLRCAEMNETYETKEWDDNALGES